MAPFQDHKGFTLVETLVAIVVLSVGLLALAGFTTGIMRSNAFTNRMTTAMILAQEKMEDIRRLGYSGLPATDKTTTEDYGSIAHGNLYKRTIWTDVANPAGGMKTVTVTVYWDGDSHSTSLKTIVAQ